jgi:hypothetical protein
MSVVGQRDFAESEDARLLGTEVIFKTAAKKPCDAFEPIYTHSAIHLYLRTWSPSLMSIRSLG